MEDDAQRAGRLRRSRDLSIWRIPWKIIHELMKSGEPFAPCNELLDVRIMSESLWGEERVFFYGPGGFAGSRRSVLIIENPEKGLSESGVELKVPLMMSVHTGSVKKASAVQC